MRGCRNVVAVLAAGAVMVAVLLVPAPASACSCMRSTVEMALDSTDREQAVAIVTRTDDGGVAATFEVHEAIGADLPDTLSGEVDNGASCQPHVPAGGGVAALIFEKRQTWQLRACGSVHLADALQTARGDPETEPGGPPVAVAAGSYGGARLAALDAHGRVVAWDGLAGETTDVAVCSGGDHIVAVGSDEPVFADEHQPELTVHDAATLEPLRTVRLPFGRTTRVLAVRCADDAADRIQLLTSSHVETPTGQLVRIDGSDIVSVRVGPLGPATAVSDGFVAIAGDPPRTVVSIAPDGDRRTLRELDVEAADQLAVTGDGTTVAVFGYRNERPNVLLTLDTDSGKVVGEWAPPEHYVSGLAWTDSGRLLVRTDAGYNQVLPPLRVLDRDLNEIEARPAPTGYGLVTVGNDAVTYRDARLHVAGRDGSLIVDELRLAATNEMAAIGPANFSPATEPTAAPSPPTDPSTAPDEVDLSAARPREPIGGLMVVGVIATTAAGGLALLFGIRRRTRRPTDAD